jgi:hypothetical protein
MDTEKMIKAQKAYDDWYQKACLVALKIGEEGTAVSGRPPNIEGVYPDLVITLVNGFRFTVSKPPCE